MKISYLFIVVIFIVLLPEQPNVKKAKCEIKFASSKLNCAFTTNPASQGKYAVEPVTKDHPKIKAEVVTYDR